jgi:hypothetical protein
MSPKSRGTLDILYIMLYFDVQNEGGTDENSNVH